MSRTVNKHLKKSKYITTKKNKKIKKYKNQKIKKSKNTKTVFVLSRLV
jgi:hypothetical protein